VTGLNKIIAISTILLLSCLPALGRDAGIRQPAVPETARLGWPSDLPVYDHIVIVVEENKDYGEIIGNKEAPYINNVLAAEGASFTQFYAEEHFSQGNYYWLFSGANHGIGFTDRIPSAGNPSGYPFTAPNLGQQLIDKGLSFKGYSEGLPRIGFTGEGYGLYARKHVPWISFSNVPNGNTLASSSNLRFDDFPSSPSGYDALPTVAFVIPNLIDDMHDGPLSRSIPAGDRWLRKHIDPYYRWAKHHNSLLILTFDENHDRQGYRGLTNPMVDPASCAGSGSCHELCLDLRNRIVTIFAGAHIKPGRYPEHNGITHVNLLRTLEAMYGLSKAGAQQPNAAGNGITDNYVITDVFKTRK